MKFNEITEIQIETLKVHSLLDTVLHGGCRKPIYIYMKRTDRIFQQTNDTSDVSFFDEYIDMKLLIFILHRIKYTIENAENHIYIYTYTDPTDRIVQLKIM